MFKIRLRRNKELGKNLEIRWKKLIGCGKAIQYHQSLQRWYCLSNIWMYLSTTRRLETSATKQIKRITKIKSLKTK